MRRFLAAGALTVLLLEPTDFAGADAICGDVNDNGTVSASDALLVLRKGVGQPVALSCPAGSQLPRTGQTEDFGPASDGVAQTGAARSFTDNGDGTITDNGTGLMWEKKDDSGGIHDKDNAYVWTAGTTIADGTVVTSFLATLNGGDAFAGYNDWRLPNVYELESLRNMGAVNPVAFAPFHTGCVESCTVLTCSCTRPSPYWSSSTYTGYPLDAWIVDFYDGIATNRDKRSSFGVRAVRGGS